MRTTDHISLLRIVLEAQGLIIVERNEERVHSLGLRINYKNGLFHWLKELLYS